MTRWHESSCTSPNIFLTEDQLPNCHACGRICPSVDVLVAQRDGGADSVTLPEDELPGQMALWWPQSVPYVRTKERPPSTGASLPILQESKEGLEQSSFYAATLGPDEFRLVCLSAVTNQDYPLHLTLETFGDDDHPEYECTSYSWGGEDGDSSLCQPVYIGEHWDILLQTQNCWSMLRFLRPWRGVRMVWVDAVCIDQRNREEQGAQVAKMRRIYETCLRVVLYLGEDIVARSTRFPALRHLDTLEHDQSSIPLFPADHHLSNKHYTLQDLLSRRYFTRVWVIQELIVSQRVLIRVGNVDFSADAHIIRQMMQNRTEDKAKYQNIQHSNISIRGEEHNLLKPQGVLTRRLSDNSAHLIPRGDYIWSATAAPWFVNLAHKVFPRTEVRDLFDLLKLTATSSASDPRDRLFGVVALLDRPFLQTSLTPDYSLSFNHFSIGLFAHLLTLEKRYWFLGSAGVVSEPQQQNLRHIPSWVPECRDHSKWRVLFQRASTGALSSGAQLHHAPFPLYLDKANRLQTDSSDHEHSDFSWPSDTIDSASGTLIMSVAHVFSFEAGVAEEGGHGALSRYVILRRNSRGVSVPSKLLLVTHKDVDIQPSRDHLCIPVSMPNVYLILRRTTHVSALASFELVTACVRVIDPKKQLQEFELYFLANEDYKNAEDWATVGTVPSIRSLQTKLGAEIRLFRWRMRNWSRNSPYTHSVADLIPEGPSWRKTMRDVYEDPKLKSFVLWSLWKEHAAQRHDRFHEFLVSILALCVAIYEDEINMAKNGKPLANRHLEAKYLHLIDDTLFHRLVRVENETHIEYNLDVRHWDDWCYKDFYDMNRHYRLDSWWQWRHAAENVWHEVRDPKGSHTSIRETADFMHKTLRDAQLDKRQGGYFVLRISLNRVITYLRGFLDRIQHILRRIIAAYDAPPDLEALADLIKNGAETEQESIGMGCYMADMKTDGRVSQVRIV